MFSNVFFGKWKLMILYELSDGEKRFGDIKKSLGNLSSKILTQSTEELLNEGLIMRVPYPEVPPRVCYRLSKQGRAFLPLLEQMLNASHLSQRYELEDKILKYYPQEISRLNERISEYTADFARREENTPAKKEDFPPMQIYGTVYTEKAEAGKALIEACKQLTNSDPVSIGSYRGFEMQLFYEAFSKEYRVALKGALTHTASLGTDIHGNITRLDNALNGLETRLQEHRDRLENTTAQMEAAKADAAKPFPREQELQEKSKRLAELTKLLKMDEKDRELLDSAPDEGDEQPERKVVGLER